MHLFLEVNQDYLLFIAGIAFVLLGFTACALSRHDDKNAWRWLGAFGFARGIHSWIQMLRLADLHVTNQLDFIEPLFLAIAAILLVEFARTLFAERHRGRPGRWIHLPLLASAGAIAFFTTRGALSWVHLTLTPLAGLWSAHGLWQFHHASNTRAESVRWKITAVVLAFAITALTAALLIPDLTDYVHPEVLAFNSAVLSTSVCLVLGWCYGLRAQKSLPADRVKAWRMRRTLWITFGILTIASGWLAAHVIGTRRDHAMRRDVLARSELVAAAMKPELLRSLEWSDSDLQNPAYQNLKALLISLVKANPDLRFVLLAGIRGDHCFFIADSEPPESADYSPPGQLYSEAAPAYVSGMQSREKFVVGPVRDRWGIWVLASVPLIDLGSDRGAINAEIDISGGDWSATILRERLPVAVIVLLILSLLLLSFHGQERIRDQMENLALSEQRNTTLVEGSPDCVQMLDLDGRCLTVNHRGLVALGCPSATVIGRPFAELWPIPVRPLIATAMRETALGKPTHFEADYIRPDGRLITWRVTTNPVRDTGGHVRSFVCICTDITESKNHERTLLAAKDAAESADRAKSEFLAVMSHEIRTPLGGVIGMLDILQRQPQSGEQRRYTGMALKSAESLLEILDDILDAAKVESGRLHLETIAFRPREEFLRVLEVMKLRAEARRLNLSWSFDPALPSALLGDPTRLRQVLANLLSNAIKFTSTGGITVTIDRAAEIGEKVSLRLRVRDTGIGIPPEARIRLFEKFSQADATTTRRYGGTGLGLSIIKGLVEQMGGSVSVESTPGEGSLFTLHVPLAIASESQLTELNIPLAATPQLPRHTCSLRLLCAEDDIIHREIAANQAREMGHIIVFAHDGAEALEKLRTSDFDAVLMDNRMPVMDGFQATRAIRSGSGNVRQPLIPIVAVTANASTKYRDECLTAGMNDFLTKPLRQSEFHRALSTILENRSASTPATTESTAPAGLTEAELLALLDEPPAPATSTPISLLNPRLVALYFEETPGRFAELSSALERKDHVAFARAAHSLKSTSAYVGSPELCELGATMEKLADSAQLAALAEPLARAQRVFAELQERSHSLPRVAPLTAT